MAVADPSDLHAQDLLRDLTGTPIRIALATGAAIEEALQRYYGGAGETVAAVLEDLNEADFLILHGEEGVADLAALESIANEAPIVRLVNLLLLKAIEASATDIHLEPFEDEVKVRYRIDGILYEVEAPPKRLFPAVLSRIKLMAGMDITEKRLPQDGRIRLRLTERDLDLRVAVAPNLHGESAVLAHPEPRKHVPVPCGIGILSTGPAGFRPRRRAAARNDPGHRADGQRQDHHAICRTSKLNIGERRSSRSRIRWSTS